MNIDKSVETSAITDSSKLDVDMDNEVKDFKFAPVEKNAPFLDLGEDNNEDHNENLTSDAEKAVPNVVNDKHPWMLFIGNVEYNARGYDVENVLKQQLDINTKVTIAKERRRHSRKFSKGIAFAVCEDRKSMNRALRHDGKIRFCGRLLRIQEYNYTKKSDVSTTKRSIVKSRQSHNRKVGKKFEKSFYPKQHYPRGRGSRKY